MQPAVLNGKAQWLARTEQMLLTNEFVERLWPQPVSEWAVRISGRCRHDDDYED
jgi:hypothetical protein